MANSTTNLDPVTQSQASKEVTINAYFDAASTATLYGRRASTTVGLTWGYYGGNTTLSSGSMSQISNGTVGLTASATNYIVAAKSSGAVTASTSTTNWNNTTNYWRLYSVVTGTSSMTSYTDSREIGKMTGGGTGSAITVKDEGSNLTTALASLDFVGAGVTATNTGGAVTVTILGGAGVAVSDEGSSLTASATSIDFVGGGVTATNSGSAVTVTIGGSASITAKEEGTNLTTSLSSINFAGAGVTATNSSGDVTVTIPGGAGREMLSSNRTYYVRTDGSDSNNGLANTSGGAFLTIQKCIDIVCSTLDVSAGVTVTCQVADGTYTGANVMKQFIGAGSFVIQGNSGTPSNVIISVTSNHCFYNPVGGTTLTVKDMKLTTTTGGSCLLAANGGAIQHQNTEFGACAAHHRYAVRGGHVLATGNYTITGGAQCHESANRSGVVECSGKTITITGTPNFSVAYAAADSTGHVGNNTSTFSGSATGVRYALSLNGTINTLSGGANYYPGNSAGTNTDGSGVYA